MARPSGCSSQFETLKLSDTDSTLSERSESDYLTAASTTESENRTPSSSLQFLLAEIGSMGGSMGGGTESGPGSGGAGGGMSVEEQIERSKSHWSLLAEFDSDSDGDGEVAEESNVRVFRSLQLHPTWGSFFVNFDGDGLRGERSAGELEVGEKFAEGGQAELFHAQFTSWDPKYNERARERGYEWVVKVFKKGTFLRHLQRQLPHGLLQFHAQEVKNWKSPKPKLLPRLYCDVHRATLLRDGRFAFLMKKEHFDLRTVIERNRKLRSDQNWGLLNTKWRSAEDCGPFLKEEAECIMYKVALGMHWLHSHGIVHRDLKASNVLVKELTSVYPKWYCYVADYECSVGVVGTGCFRAPEILQACKEGKTRERPEVFSKEADVYSFGMTCYEILTGKLPFEGYGTNGYDLVLNGHRPAVPEYVEDWMRELLSRCWQANPTARPCEEMVHLFLANSQEARKIDECLKKDFGESYKSWYDSKSFV